jgi:hypothetical protein
MADEIIESIEGFQMDTAQKAPSVHGHLDYLDRQIDALVSVLDGLAQPYESQISLLCTIPGVNRKSATPSSPRLVQIRLNSPLPSEYAPKRASPRSTTDLQACFSP